MNCASLLLGSLIHRRILDNGKVFTARFGLGSGEVLFDRLCREHGVRHLLTAPRSPTTTGKVERFHKTLRAEFLAGRVFASLEEAQAALEEWVARYNAERPHQGIGMAAPAERFAPGAPQRRVAAAEAAPPAAGPPSYPRKVSREGRLNFADQRYQVGAWLAGETVEVTCRDGLLEVSHRGVLVASLARRGPARLAAPPPGPLPPRPATSGRAVVRKVAPGGEISFAGTGYRVGSAYRGEQVEVRLVGDAVQISKDGVLLKSWPARHDRMKEHGAFSTPGGRPQRINAAQYLDASDVTQVPKPMRNTGGET